MRTKDAGAQRLELDDAEANGRAFVSQGFIGESPIVVNLGRAMDRIQEGDSDDHGTVPARDATGFGQELLVVVDVLEDVD
jgi:hypothetical protein